LEGTLKFIWFQPPCYEQGQKSQVLLFCSISLLCDTELILLRSSVVLAEVVWLLWYPWWSQRWLSSRWKGAGISNLWVGERNGVG